MSIKTNLFRNGIATAVQRLVGLLDQLLLVPFFLSAWGATYYGEWLTLTVIPTVFALSDLGLGSAAANTFVLRYVGGDRKGAASVAKFGISVLSMLCCLGLLLGALILCILLRHGIMFKTAIPSQPALLAVGLLMLSRLLSFYYQLLEGFYRAGRRAALGINLISSLATLKVLLSILVLLFHGDVVAIAVADLSATVAFLYVYAWLAQSLLPDLEWRKAPWPSRTECRILLKKGGAYLLSPAWQATLFQGTTLAVRATVGAEGVAVFNTVRALCRSVNQLYGMINATIFPELQYEIGAGRIESARRLFRLGMGAAGLTAFVGITVLSFAAPWFYSVWTKGLLHAPREVWAVFLFGILLNAVWWTGSMVFRAANLPEGFGIVGMVSATLAVLASWILAHRYGIMGAAIGSIIFEVIMLVYVVRGSCRILSQHLVQLPVQIVHECFTLLSKRPSVEQTNIGSKQ